MTPYQSNCLVAHDAFVGEDREEGDVYEDEEQRGGGNGYESGSQQSPARSTHTQSAHLSPSDKFHLFLANCSAKR